MGVLELDIKETLEQEFIPYAGESLINFIPSIDGCLPVHRKVAISMLRNHRTPENSYTKTIKVMGEIVSYYVFGDNPLYSSMVNMANDSMNIPYIDGKGSWGTKFRSDGYPAHQRYTECKATEYLLDMLNGLNKNNVPMKPNFDNTSDEMIIMPSLPPNILLNNSQSIAVSEASKIPPHNAIDTCNSIIGYIKSGDIDEAIKNIKCPDFRNGGSIVYDEKVFNDIYKTGKGSFSIIGKYRYIQEDNIIQIYEVPYETTLDKIEEDLRKAYDTNKIKEITNIRNACDRNGLNLEITLKRNTNVDEFIAKLIKYTSFESKYSVNFTILDLDWKTPILVNLQGIYDRWIKHRINCINNEIMFDIDKNSKQLHLLYGLKSVLLDIDKAIVIIRNAKNETEAIKGLKDYFKIDDIQAKYVSEIKLININKDYILKRIKDIEKLEDENKKLKVVNNNDKLIKEIIIQQLQYVIKKYSKPRKTQILYNIPEISVDKKEEIENYNVTYFLTEHGYFKKVPLTSMRNAGDNKIKDDDRIIKEVQGQNIDDILFFTNKGNTLRLKGYKVDDCKLSQFGNYLPSEFGLTDEYIVNMSVPNYDSEDTILVCYDNGYLTRVKIGAYNSSNKLLKGNTESENLLVEHLKSDAEIMMMTTEGKALIFNTNEVPIVSSRASKGVKGINVADGHKVVKIMLNPVDNSEITIKTEQKEIKKKIDKNYYKGSRSNTGIFLYNTRPKKDRIVNVK